MISIPPLVLAFLLPFIIVGVFFALNAVLGIGEGVKRAVRDIYRQEKENWSRRKSN